MIRSVGLCRRSKLQNIAHAYCSCSAIPLFMGFPTAGVHLGVTFSLLVSAPMVNDFALVILFGLFGWKVAGLYMATGLTIALITSVVIGRLNKERCLEDWGIELTSDKSASGQISIEEETLTWQERIGFELYAVKDIVLKVWPNVTIGIAVGAGIHGYMPENFLAGIMAKEAWWTLPMAVCM